MISNLWQKYNSLPRMGRLWIGISTAAVAYFGGEMVDKMYDNQLIKEEAERRIKQEAILERQRLQSQQASAEPESSKPGN